MGGKTKPKKMSISEFMGGTPARDIDLLPSAPKQRGPDDDGSFRRNNMSMRDRDRDRDRGRDRYNNDRQNNGNRRNSDMDDQQQGSWRSNRSRDSFRERDNMMGNSNRDRDNVMDNNGPPPSRADGDSSWRRGERAQPPPSRSSDRYNDRYNRSDSDNRYNRYDSGPDRWGSNRTEQPRERTRLQLSKRSIPLEKPKEEPANSNIFGGATAVDTASRLAAYESKQKTVEKKEEGFETKPSFPINSRAAALEAQPKQSEAPLHSSFSGRYRDKDRSSSNAYSSVSNRRFSDLGNENEDRRYQRHSQRYSRNDDRRFDDHQSRYSSNRYSQPSQPSRFNVSDNFRRQNQDYTNNTDPQPTASKEPEEVVKEEEFPALAPIASELPSVAAKSNLSQKQQLHQQQHKEDTRQKQQQKEEERLKKLKEEEEEKLKLEEETKKQEEEKLLKTFCTTCGKELVSFIDENSSKLPDLETLFFTLLQFYEKEDISWAKEEKHGLGIKHLLEGKDMKMQLQLLWAVQKYCNSINFPKNKVVKDNEQWYIHTLFRVLLENDFVTLDSYSEWKDDETTSKDVGKTKAIIQTMDWFNWLDEILCDGDEEEDDYDDYDNEDDEDDYQAY